MQAAQYIHNSQDFSDIKLVTVNKPSLEPGYALVKIYSAAINPIDFLVFHGFLKGVWPMPLPFIPGYDFSGVVEAVSEDVSGFSVGEEVFAVNWGQGNHGTADHPIGGAFAEYIAIPASKLSRKPANVSHQQAAALALVGTTALEGLDTLQVTAGTKILILGGSTSVGAIAIQMAKRRGAHVITTASSRSLEFAKQYGADQTINYNETKWWLAAESGLADLDAIYDAVGEADGWAHAQTPGLVKTGGRFISIAAHDVGYNPVGHQPAFSHAAFFCLSNSPAVQDELVALLSSGELKLAVESEFPFTQQGVWDLFAKVKSGKSLGKSVINIVEA